MGEISALVVFGLLSTWLSYLCIHKTTVVQDYIIQKFNKSVLTRSNIEIFKIPGVIRLYGIVSMIFAILFLGLAIHRLIRN